MKAILFAAAALMTGASVYGLVDYNKRSGDKDFENLYRKDKPAETRATVPATLPVAAEKNTKLATVDEKLKVAVKQENEVKALPKKKRKVSFKTFSRAEPEVRLAD